MIPRLLGLRGLSLVVSVLALSLFAAPASAQSDTSFVLQVEAPTVPTALLAELRESAAEDSIASADSAAVEETSAGASDEATGTGSLNLDSLGTASQGETPAPDSIVTSEGDAAAAAMDLLIRARDAGSDLPANVVALMIRDALTQPANDTLWSRLEQTVTAVYGDEALASVLPPDGTSLGDTQDISATSASESPTTQVDQDPGAIASETTMAEEPASQTPPGEMNREDLVALWESASSAVAARVEASVEQIRVLALTARERLGINNAPLVWVPWVIVGLLALGLVLQLMIKTARGLLSRMGLATTGAYRRAAKVARRLSRKGASGAEVARKTGLPREAIQVLDILTTREKARTRAASRKSRRAKGAKEVA